MLLAVEGGGLFSSSASGYSKGLSLLLLGQRSDESKHMRVTPWNLYQLVHEETDSDHTQLASGKERLSRGCASFVCFGRASAGPDGQSPLKVGPATQQQDILPGSPTIERDKEMNTTVDYGNHNARNATLKSSLKKPTHSVPQTNKNNSEDEPLAQEGTNHPGQTERKKVQWTDACGEELADIREFELSEAGESDEEFIGGNGKTCSCSIM